MDSRLFNGGTQGKGNAEVETRQAKGYERKRKDRVSKMSAKVLSSWHQQVKSRPKSKPVKKRVTQNKSSKRESSFKRKLGAFIRQTLGHGQGKEAEAQWTLATLVPTTTHKQSMAMQGGLNDSFEEQHTRSKGKVQTNSIVNNHRTATSSSDNRMRTSHSTYICYCKSA